MKANRKMANWFFISLIAVLVAFSWGQLYFPDDMSDGKPLFVSAPVVPQNLAQIRGTPEYNALVDRIISRGITKLTIAVDKALTLNAREKNDNVVFAPISISAALALILMGSNGKTFQELVNIMGLATGVDIQTKSQLVHEQFGRMIKTLETHAGFDIGRHLNFASAIFVQNNYPIRTAFKEAAEELYESEVLNVDFQSDPSQAQKIINAWVADRTEGKINNILAEEPPSSSRVIVTSALYFKAEWEYPFFEGTTKKKPFYPNGRKNGPHILVEMMANGGNFPYYKDYKLNCEMIGFPYKGNQTTMYVLMPLNSNKESLKTLESSLTAEEIERLVERTVYTPTVVIFPKMKIESTIDLKKTLQLLGIKSLFDPKEANLALLSPGLSPNPMPVGDRAEAEPLAAVNPIAPSQNQDDVLIFSRLGTPVNCSSIFNPNSSVSTCEDTVTVNNTEKKVVYKKLDNKVGRRVMSRIGGESLDTIRQTINSHSNLNSYQNPGLYADSVIHKVYMDITETGTEAAAATSVSLSRDGSRISFRADSPFIFFIWHESSKNVLFWGSVTKPTPNFS